MFNRTLKGGIIESFYRNPEPQLVCVGGRGVKCYVVTLTLLNQLNYHQLNNCHYFNLACYLKLLCSFFDKTLYYDFLVLLPHNLRLIY